MKQTHSITIKIAEIPIRLTLPEKTDIRKFIHPHLKPFVSNNGIPSGASITLYRIEKDKNARLTKQEKLLFRNCLETLFGKEPPIRKKNELIESTLLHIEHYCRNPSCKKIIYQISRNPQNWMFLSIYGDMFFYNHRTLKGSFFTFINHHEKSVSTNLLNAVSCVASFLCAKNNALFLHGVGLSIDGKGHLFLGHSNAGKSTIASLAGKDHAISDDGIIAKQINKKWYLFSTPLLQKTTIEKNHAVKKVPFSDIYFLSKSKKTKLVRLDKKTVLAHMLKYHLHFFRYFPDALSERTFKNARNLVEHASCAKLHFAKSKAFLKLLKHS